MAINKKTFSDNELIKKRRKRRRVKRLLFFFIVIISTFITLCYKLPYFNVTNIYVENNKILDRDFIVETSGLKKGSNVFFVNFKEAKKKLLSNPYILNCDITRKLPNTFTIKVNERKASYYIRENNKFYIIDNNGILLEEKTNIDNFNLIEIQGVDFDSSELGKVFVSGKDKERILYVLTTLQELFERGINPSVMQSLGLKEDESIQIKKVDFSQIYNIKVDYNNIHIYCGDGSNLEEKIKEAINIISQQNLFDKKGYIDLSFSGNPVYYIQP